MPQGYVARNVRSATWTMLILSAVLLCLTAAALSGARDYYYNIFNGPFPCAKDQLLDSARDPRHAYLVVDFGQLSSTGFARFETRDGVKTGVVNSRFYAVPINHRWLLVEAAGRQSGPVLRGELKPLDRETQTKVLAPLEAHHPRLAAQFAPVMFVAKNYAASGYLGLAVAAIAAFFGVVGVFKGAAGIANPRSHPAYRALANIGDVQALEAQIDSELSAGARGLGRCVFTANWILLRQGMRFQVMRISQIIWIYQRTLRQTYNGIPAGKKHFIVLCDRDGGKIEIPAAQQVAVQVIGGIAKTAPWAVVGFDADTKRKWKTNRAALAAAADARKAAAVISKAVAA